MALSSQGSSVSVPGSTIRASTPTGGMPCRARTSASSSSLSPSYALGTLLMEPSGLVSVMPQACRIGRPSFSLYASDSAFGTAEPPHRTTRSADRSRPSSSGSMPIQMVGTPPVMVTRSSSSIATILPGPSAGRAAPARRRRRPATCAKPQALAWNIGTTGRIRSRSVSPKPPAASATPASAGRASGASRPRPWGCRSCRTCSTSRPPRFSSSVAKRAGAASASRLVVQPQPRGRPGSRRRAVVHHHDVAHRLERRPSFQNSGSSDRSTNMTSSSAWLAM